MSLSLLQIGQGRFGKVYTAVNNSTGELMAMKEIAIQPGETKAIKNVAEELKIFEGINHKHLVKLYGVEIHRVSHIFAAMKYIHKILPPLEHYIDEENIDYRRNYSYSWSCVRRERWKVLWKCRMVYMKA